MTNWDYFMAGKIPMDCERIDVVVGTEDRPATRSDVEETASIFSQVFDHFCATHRVPSPKLSFGRVVGQFPSCRSPRLTAVASVETAVNPSFIGMPDDGVKLLLIGDDDHPASQKDIDDVRAEIENANNGATWLVSHHAVDITYC